MSVRVAVIALLASLSIASPAAAGPTPAFPATVPMSRHQAHQLVDHWVRDRVMPQMSRRTTYRVNRCSGTQLDRLCPVVFREDATTCRGVMEVWQDSRNFYLDLHHYRCDR